MTASVVLVTYGQWALTEQCLSSLQAALGERLGRDWEIVIVDNASPDDTPEQLRAWSDRATIELRSDNLNFAGGCNRGAELATGEVLIFLNNDTTVAPGALEALAAQATEPGVSAAGCRLLFPDGTIQHAGVAFLSNRNLRGTPMPQHVFHHQAGELPGTRGVYECDSVTAACIAVRRDAFLEVGGYETRYVNGLEDIDLCLKLRSSGHTIVYRGDVDIVHHEGASRGKGEALYATEQKLATMAANDHLFISRWGAQLEQDDELAAGVWDAGLRDGFAARNLSAPATVVLIGQPTGLGPGADEARAFLTALVALGHNPAGMDLPNPNVIARPSGQLAQTVERAMRTPLRADVPFVCVPMGPSDRFYHPSAQPTPGSDAVVRLGLAETALDLGAEPKLLAASHAVADALVQGGMNRGRVFTMPSPLAPRQLGTGGAGVFVVLPTHDARLTTELLQGLSRLAASCAIRLLPTVFDRRLSAQVSDSLPNAELLPPCSDEERLAGWFAEADVVLAGAVDDPFERPALLAASTGTPALSLNPRGPVFDVLGVEATVAPHDVARAITEALGGAGDRQQLRERVLDACAPALLADLLEAGRPDSS